MKKKMLAKKSKKNCCDCDWQVKTKKRSKRRSDGSKRVFEYTVHTGRYIPNLNKESSPKKASKKSPKKSPKKSSKKSPKKSNKLTIYGLGAHEMSLMR